MGENTDIQWALDLLTPDPDHKESLFSRWCDPACFSILGFISPFLRNHSLRRPLHAGIQFNFGLAAVGAVLGIMWRDWNNKRYAERDAVFRDYIKHHPEDFPEPERKKYRDVLEPWFPVR